MARFSEYFSIGLTQHEIDFVDISTDIDTSVYVDPYAIEIRNDVWSSTASDYLRTFFSEVLEALRKGSDSKARHLMSHLKEPRETCLGVSRSGSGGRGIGDIQAKQLIDAIKKSQAFETGLLSDLSEMSLYIEGVDRDKVSDLTTNVIRKLLVNYTQEQCQLFGIETKPYSGPPMWNNERKDWESRFIELPYIGEQAIILVSKYIVRRKLSLDSQEFYNKQITDFLVAEHERANSSLAKTIKKKQGKRIIEEKKVYKKDVRKHFPKSKSFIAKMVEDNPKLLVMYKDIVKESPSFITTFSEEQPSIHEVCKALKSRLLDISPGAEHAEDYHKFIMGTCTALFFPNLIQPNKEWKINDGRKRIDIVYTNASDSGFFAQRRDGNNTQANLVIVECKNYSNDIANPELDQLLGRFDDNRGKFGILTCRAIDNPDLLLKKCRDMASRSQGFIIVLTDEDILEMLEAKASLKDDDVEKILHSKFRELLG